MLRRSCTLIASLAVGLAVLVPFGAAHAAPASLGTVAIAAPTAAAAAGCVTKREFRRVHNGLTKRKVHKIFGTSGSVLFSNPGAQMNEAREYRTCRAFRRSAGAKVQVQYNNYAANGGPLRVVHKQTY